MTARTPTGDNAVQFTYDLSGQVTQISRPGDGVTLTQSYDALGRLLSEGQPFGSASYLYDSAGRLTRITWSDAFFVTYDYDTTGNVTAIRENGAASGAGVLATYSYDNLGRRTGIARGNGTSTSYSFDPVSRLTALGQDLTGTTSDQTIGSMTYNPAGQITAQTKSNDAFAWSGHYNVARNYTVNGLNQQTVAGPTTLGYDARGNLTTSGSSTFGYDKLNQLTSGPGITLGYDPVGRLTQVAGSVGTTRFSYAGGQMIGEYATNGTLLRRYVPGPGVNEPVTWYEGTGTADKRWLHADERGSVIAVSDGSGAMLSVNRYDEYGIPQSGNLGRFQYTGQAWLPEVGLYYYKARMYSPTLGRFMQTDPIGYGDGLNWYNYVGSDPINATDPWGMDCIIPTTDDPCQEIQVTHKRKSQEITYTYSQDYTFVLIKVGDGPWENTQTISPCMQKFLASQGLGAPNLGSVKFREGDGGSLAAKAAFWNGNPAITVQNIIYVKPGHWEEYAPGTAGFFEEVVHTIQWDQSGAANFAATYLGESLFSGAFGKSMHDNPIEAQAGGMSIELEKAYAASGNQCP